jgi:hypothetical protein
MTGFFVSQNQTYKIEHEKQILWSPQKNKIGGDNRGYINMSNVKKEISFFTTTTNKLHMSA